MAWGTVKGIAVHHSDSPERQKHYQCVQTADAIEDYHRRNGYRAVAYTSFGCHHGYTWSGRGFGDSTGANGTAEANRSYPSICIIGDHPKATEGVARAIQTFRAEVLRRWPNATEVKPHKAFVGTACPGIPLTQWIRDKKYIEREEEEEVAQFTEDQARFLRVLAQALVDKDMAGYRPVEAVEALAAHLKNHSTGNGSHTHPHTHTVSKAG